MSADSSGCNCDTSLRNSANIVPEREPGAQQESTSASSDHGLERHLSESATAETDIRAEKAYLVVVSDDSPTEASPEPSITELTIANHAKHITSPPVTEEDSTQEIMGLKDGEPTCKKRRLDEVDTSTEEKAVEEKAVEGTGPAVPTASAFLHLPFDIFEEILLQTGDPGDLLAITRTCKALYAKLLEPAASLIWKKMRILVGLPDPAAYKTLYEDDGSSVKLTGVQCFVHSEPAYAAFIFGGGVCRVCGETTERMCHSFASGTRVCDSEACATLVTGAVAEETFERGDHPVWSILSRLESRPLPDNIMKDVPWLKRQIMLPTMSRTVKSNTSTSFVPAWTEPQWDESGIIQIYDWIKFCVDLRKWHKKWETEIRNIKNQNEIRGKVFASSEGWDYSDMLNSTLYGEFFNGKLKRREGITDKELERMRPTIAQDLHRLQEKRDRKAVKRLQETSRNKIWKFYQKLLSQSEHYPHLPPFAVFLQLPAIQFLQSSDLATAKIEVEIAVGGKTFMKDMIKHQIEKWVEQAKRELLKILGGSGEWNNMVPAHRMPHPVLRLNARWKCKVCGGVERKYEADECLDFAGACRHQCPEKDGKKRRKGAATQTWSASNFVKDEQAYAAMTACLERLDVTTEELTATRSRFGKTSWCCMSCDPPLFLRSESIVGHSHRHPAPMKVDIVQPDNAFTMKPRPNRPGLTQWLLGNSKDAKEWVGKVNYGCQHCTNIRKREELVQKQPKEVEPEDKSSSASSGEPGKTLPRDANLGSAKSEDEGNSGAQRGNPPADDAKENTSDKKFNFNGLRSHLSSKHKIYQIRDEDFWCYEPVSKFPVELASMLFDLF